MNNKILVIGSANVDFLIKSEKLPRLGETVTDGLFMQNYGGKGANQAVGAARSGGNVAFITCLGDDLYADEIIGNFGKDGIDSRYVFKEYGVATGSALVMLDSKGNNYLSVAPGANYRLTREHIDVAIELFREAELILIQMEIPLDTTSYIFELAKKYRKRIVFNLAPARPFDLTMLENVYAFVVNEVETSMVTGLRVESEDEIKVAALALLNWGPEMVIITLGAKGSFVATKKESQFVPAFNVNATDTTAAGDIYCGSLAVALAEGKSLVEAVLFAGAASAISVTRLGAQPSAPTRDEIDALLLTNV